MKKSEVLATLLSDLARQVERLSDEDLQNIAEGLSKLEIRIVKSKPAKASSSALSDEEIKELISSIEESSSREEALKIIEPKTKKILEEIAKKLDVAILKSDKTESIRSKIIEATVGARLRSKAIQGT